MLFLFASRSPGEWTTCIDVCTSSLCRLVLSCKTLWMMRKTLRVRVDFNIVRTLQTVDCRVVVERSVWNRGVSELFSVMRSSVISG